MMSFKNRATQIIELLPTCWAFVPLAMGLMGMKPALVHAVGATLRALHAVRPAQLAYHRKALGIIDQVLDIQHGPILTAIAFSATSLKPVISAL
jgi:hypothetical protein